MKEGTQNEGMCAEWREGEKGGREGRKVGRSVQEGRIEGRKTA